MALRTIKSTAASGRSSWTIWLDTFGFGWAEKIQSRDGIRRICVEEIFDRLIRYQNGMESQKGGWFIETILKTIHFRRWVSWSATPKLKRSTLQQNKIWRSLVTIIACRVEDISTTHSRTQSPDIFW